MIYDSGCTKLNEKISNWLEWDRNPKTRREIEDLVVGKKYVLLRERLMQRLTFGTAGLRGIMRAGFESMNDVVIIQTAQGK